MPQAPAGIGLFPGFVICHAADPAAPPGTGKPYDGKRDCPFALINRLAMATADAPHAIAAVRSRREFPYVLPLQCASDRRAVSAFLARGPPPFDNGNPTEKA
ncbi:hypothetical protein [Breoghania sp.]|uniref:hypothetical protein n=1 Tax=Breoghania sp. TaxID=2065378 RepID=UPI002AA814B1|nr:hypothetical protein [Breoghania sp.]